MLAIISSFMHWYFSFFDVTGICYNSLCTISINHTFNHQEFQEPATPFIRKNLPCAALVSIPYSILSVSLSKPKNQPCRQNFHAAPGADLRPFAAVQTAQNPELSERSQRIPLPKGISVFFTVLSEFLFQEIPELHRQYASALLHP